MPGSGFSESVSETLIKFCHTRTAHFFKFTVGTGNCVLEHIQLLVAVAHGAKFMEISRTFVGLLVIQTISKKTLKTSDT
jgi:hypothetical protein